MRKCRIGQVQYTEIGNINRAVHQSGLYLHGASDDDHSFGFPSQPLMGEYEHTGKNIEVFSCISLLFSSKLIVAKTEIILKRNGKVLSMQPDSILINVDLDKLQSHLSYIINHMEYMIKKQNSQKHSSQKEIC
jgi:hypothetical protein